MDQRDERLIIAELSILHEITSLAYQGSESLFADDVVEKTIRMFGGRRIAFLVGPFPTRLAVSFFGFRSAGEAERRVLESGAEQFCFPLGEQGALGVLYLEQSYPIDSRERRLLSILAHKVENELLTAQRERERVQAEHERIEMERKLLHAQKLQSLGVLAGGIAHDFNNLLAVVLGRLDLALQRMSADHAARADISQALLASQRAAVLTNQLLAYSGKGTFVIQDIDLTALVEENANLFRASLAKSASVFMLLDYGIPKIKADFGQVQQIVMNLLTNASEALGDEAGTITIATGMRLCSEEFLQKSRLAEKPKAGNFVYVDVSDTGVGMDAETLERLFDPFFTTKFTGRGLGMAAVLGIVRGHHGAILVDSLPGRGTTVRVFFPVPTAGRELPIVKSENDPPAESSARHLSGLVLVADDETVVREFCREIFLFLGFDVLTASEGVECIRIFAERPRDFRLILLDLTMPTMGGTAAFRELRKIRPDIPVLLSSGYSEQEAVRQFGSHPKVAFIKKPYLVNDLKEVISRLLAAEDGKAEGFS